MADPTTPATPAPTAAATPAPSAPAPAAAATPAPAADVKRPASFGAALRQAEKDGSSPSATPASTEAPAAATVLPTDAGPDADKGPVPYTRFSEVNEKAKAAEKRASEIEKKLQALAWAEGVDQRVVADNTHWRTRAHTDLAGFVRDLIASAPPERQAQVRSEFARQLATRTDPEPTPDLQTDTGKPVYSAEQQAKWFDWRSRRQQAEWDKKLAPLQDELKQGRETRERAQRETATKTFAATAVQKATKWPYFNEHAKEIADELRTMPPGETEADEMLAVHDAYIAVLNRSVFPTLSQTAEANVRAELKTKAVAGSEHPGRASTGSPTRPKSLGASLRAELDKAGLR